MRPRHLTVETLAFAYELRHEYQWKYDAIALFLGVDRSNLNLAIARCEREGLGWVKRNNVRRKK